MFSEYSLNTNKSSYSSNINGSSSYNKERGGGLDHTVTEDENDEKVYPSSEYKLDENSNKLHPLKISMIQKFFMDNPHEHRLNLFGSINVKWRVTSSREYQDTEFSLWFKNQLNLIKNGTYVRVFGDVNLLGYIEPHVSAYIVTSLEMPQEIFYHDTEVAQWIVHKIGDKKYSRDECSPNYSNVINTNSSLSFSNLKKEYDMNSVSNMTSLSTKSGNGSSMNSNLGSTTPTRFNNSPIKNSKSPYQPKVETPQRSTNKDNFLSNNIQQIISNMSVLIPEGLLEKEIVIHLIGRGISVDRDVLTRECEYLESRGVLTRDAIGRWRI